MPDPTQVRRPKTAGVYIRRTIVITYLFFLVGWPLWRVVDRTFLNGHNYLAVAFANPDFVYAMQLTLVVALWAVAINTVFGITMAILLVRYEFPGKRLLNSFIDLPIAVSPVVIGLALLLAYGPRNGLFGPTLSDWGIQIIFSVPGLVLATTFVSLPLVLRAVIPVLQEIGIEQETAARSLGANGRQTFWRITLPSIKWAVAYGVVLSLARALGEYGAARIVVSGGRAQDTETATLFVQRMYEAGFTFPSDEQGTAYATAFLLTAIAMAALVIVTILRPKEHGRGN